VVELRPVRLGPSSAFQHFDLRRGFGGSTVQVGANSTQCAVLAITNVARVEKVIFVSSLYSKDWISPKTSKRSHATVVTAGENDFRVETWPRLLSGAVFFQKN